MAAVIPGDLESNTPVPYLPSTRWMRCFGNGMDLKTRDYTRTRICSNTPGGIVLTVPVVGGASAAKRLKPDRLMISDHGDWTRIHLGALDAAFGKEPFFQHLFPEIAFHIENYPADLMSLNKELMSEMMRFLDYEALMPEIRVLFSTHPDRCRSLAEKMEHKIEPEHSFLEVLFRFGRDALFLLE